jgi:hypothetical protein
VATQRAVTGERPMHSDRAPGQSPGHVIKSPGVTDRWALALFKISNDFQTSNL